MIFDSSALQISLSLILILKFLCTVQSSAPDVTINHISAWMSLAFSELLVVRLCAERRHTLLLSGHSPPIHKVTMTSFHLLLVSMVNVADSML